MQQPPVYAQTPYPYQQQPYPAQQPPQYVQTPYPQQQMMAPQMMLPQVVINNSMSQVNMAAGKQQISTLVRIIYFLCFGWYLGTAWAMIAALFCCSFIGLGIGIMMFRALPAIFTLQR